jgi:hypothetical protein
LGNLFLYQENYLLDDVPAKNYKETGHQHLKANEFGAK